MALTYTYDNLGRLTRVDYPDSTYILNAYTNGSGVMLLDRTFTKDRLGFETRYEYNGLRQVTKVTDPLSRVTSYAYCDCGALEDVTKAFGTALAETTHYEYDTQGRRTETHPPYGSGVTNRYDLLGRLTSVSDALGSVTNVFDNLGRVVAVSNYFGQAQARVYDIEDLPLYVTDANGVTVTNTYDNLGRLRTRTYPDGGVESFGYTANIGSMTSYTNQLSKVWTYAYDAAGRKTNEIGVGVYTNTFTYKPAGDLATLQDGKNQVTTWNYDQYGRVTNKVDQASAEILRYKYDADSRLTNRWSTAKGETKYTYDNVGNLTLVDYPSGTTDITLSYDALNRATNMVDAAGTTKYTYYTGGQLNTEDGPWTSDTVTYTYNNARLRSGLTLQQPTGSWTNGFFYDAGHRLTNVTSTAGTFAYSYKVGQASSLAIKLDLPNTSYITNTFDSVARLTGTHLKNSSHTTLNSHEYLYNAGNQRIRHTRTDASYYTNTYDNIGQLRVSDSTVASEDRNYGYDAAWNLAKRTNNSTVYTFTVNNKNELTNYNGSTFTYDSNGNLTGASSPSYTYDAENQLVSAQVTATWRSEFTYDGRSRLRKRIEYSWTGSSWYPNTETRYVYDGMRVIQERDGSNVPTVSYTRGSDLSGSFEGAGGIGGLMARSHAYQSGSGSFTNHNFYHADGGGNITYMVNGSQSMVASYRYDPFGNTISSSGTLASANVYRFSSKELHINSGTYYYGYRFYDPNLQRWLSRDPLGEAGFELGSRRRSLSVMRSTAELAQGPNLYTFVRNDPTEHIDNWGLKCYLMDNGAVYDSNKDRVVYWSSDAQATAQFIAECNFRDKLPIIGICLIFIGAGPTAPPPPDNTPCFWTGTTVEVIPGYPECQYVCYGKGELIYRSPGPTGCRPRIRKGDSL